MCSWYTTAPYASWMRPSRIYFRTHIQTLKNKCIVIKYVYLQWPMFCYFSTQNQYFDTSFGCVSLSQTFSFVICRWDDKDECVIQCDIGHTLCSKCDFFEQMPTISHLPTYHCTRTSFQEEQNVDEIIFSTIIALWSCVCYCISAEHSFYCIQNVCCQCLSSFMRLTAISL